MDGLFDAGRTVTVPAITDADRALYNPSGKNDAIGGEQFDISVRKYMDLAPAGMQFEIVSDDVGLLSNQHLGQPIVDVNFKPTTLEMEMLDRASLHLFSPDEFDIVSSRSYANVPGFQTSQDFPSLDHYRSTLSIQIFEDLLKKSPDALILLVAAPPLLGMLADHAKAQGLDPTSISDLYQMGVDLGLQANYETFRDIAASAATEAGITLALGPVGMARKAFQLLLSGEDVMDVIKLYEAANPDEPAIKAIADAARALEGTAAWEAYKSGVGTIENAVSWFADNILGQGHKQAVDAAFLKFATTSGSFNTLEDSLSGLLGLVPALLAGTAFEHLLPSTLLDASGGLTFDWSTAAFADVSIALPIESGGGFEIITVPGIVVSDSSGNFTGTFAQTGDGIPIWQVALQSQAITQTAVATAGGGLAVVTDNGTVTGQFNYAGAVDADAGPLSYFGGASNLQLESFTLTDNASGETVGQGVVVGGGEAVVTKTKSTTGMWQTDVTVHADLPGLTAAQEAALQLAAFNTHTLVGDQVGTIFGTALSQALSTDNVLEQVAAGSILAAIGQNLGQVIDAGLSTTLSMTEIVDLTLADFGADLANAFKTQALGAVSGFLLGELAESLGFDGTGFGDQILRSTLGSVTQTVLANVANQNGVFDGLLIQGTDGALQLGEAGLNLGIGISSFIGGYIAREIVAPETLAGSIGAAIGGGLGSAIGAGIAGVGTVMGSVGSAILTSIGLGGLIMTGSSLVLGIVLPGVGALIGAALGTVIGNGLEGWGDDHGWGHSTSTLDVGADELVITSQAGNDGDFTVPAYAIGTASTEIINNILASIGGTLVNDGKFLFDVHTENRQTGTFGQNSVRIDAVSLTKVGSDGSQEVLYSHDMQGRPPEEWIDNLVIAAKDHIDIAGGNIYLKRALEASTATTLAVLAGDLKIAEDYARYLANKEIIDVLIALDPDSAFSAGWIITLLRAEELGLDKFAESDFVGGFATFLQSAGYELGGASVDTMSFRLESDNLVVTFTAPGATGQQSVIIENALGLAGLSVVADAAGSATAYGGHESQIWFGNNGESNAYYESSGLIDIHNHDVLIGGDQADQIWSSGGNDFLQGNAGNDYLDAGSGDDVIVGGQGSDDLRGGRGNDTYVFARGDGMDWVYETETGTSETRLETYQQSVIVGYEPTIVYFTMSMGTKNYVDVADIPEWLQIDIDNIGGSTFGTIESADWTGEWELVQMPIRGQETAYRPTGFDASLFESDGRQDVLSFGAGILVTDLVFRLEGADLVIGVLPPGTYGTELAPTFEELTDKIRIVNWTTSTSRVEMIRLADGTVISEFDALGQPVSRIVGGGESDKLFGTAIGDIINGGAGDDSIFSAFGDDSIGGEDGNDLVKAGEGNDWIWGGLGNDWIHGEAGDDTAFGEAGDDTIGGGDGADTLRGNDGNDWLWGGRGNDTLNGDVGNDTLYGEDGDDAIGGGDGWDWIYGNSGNDWLWGGANGDRFLFSNGDGVDWIMDFVNGEDSIDLANFGLSATDLDALITSSIQWGSNNLTLQLGAGQEIILANFAKSSLDASDFVI